MKIACLQFAPQVGDVNNNLNRADSVLNRAYYEDLQDLDLLVLPELAFSGCNFKSLNQISPFLEPSTSGISSLWARTTALKYNTAVVVGYPEKVDVSDRWPTSPEYYNSAMLVNKDGETIANYRKSFLYATDERWALEGTGGFFYDRPQGLGRMAMGIGMDLNPYRFESGWDAFEFAYHVVDSHAKLVIVTMSWSTREDACTFSCMPAEPDMETLTYWAQRLEPVIRKESRDEIIVVFCNRCGKEDKVVYAGTSAVIGIKEGEVNVYGLLGRGVKDLLVVDTNVAPFAKLVNRPEGGVAGTSVDMRHNRTIEWLAQGPFTSNAADNAAVQQPGRSTRAGKATSRRHIQLSPILCSQLNEEDLLLETPIDESPLVGTPTAPSPTPLSRRPQVNDPSSIQDDYQNQPAGYQVDGDGDPLEPDSGQISEKYFWLPPQPHHYSPVNATIPVFPSVSPITKSSLLRISGNKRNSMKHLHAPEVALSPELDGMLHIAKSTSACEPQEAPHIRGRNSTQASDNRAPGRPASPKSRNASRTGRPLDSVRSSDAQQADFSGTIERLESFARPTSAMDDQYRHDKPQTPKSRSASRIGRSSTTPPKRDNIIRRDSDFETPTLTNPSIFSNSTRNTQSDAFSTSTGSIERKAREPGTIRPCPRAGARSRNRTIGGADPGRTRSRTGSSTRKSEESAPHIEPDESRTLVWSELSKLVGEVLQRPKSRDISRGRQRTPSDSSPAVLRDTHSEIRGVRENSRADHRVLSQDRDANMRSRGRQSGALRVAGVESNAGREDPHGSEDEIVAEVIFHGRGCPTHSHRQQLTPSRTGTSSQVEKGERLRPASMSRKPQTQDQSYSPRTSQKQYTSHMPKGTASPNKPSLSRCLSEHNKFEASITSKMSTISKLDARQAASGSCPPIEGMARRMVTTKAKQGSPAPTPPRVFEPTTPKAMKLDRIFAADVEPISKIVLSDDLMVLKSYGADVRRMPLRRPRSAVW